MKAFIIAFHIGWKNFDSRPRIAFTHLIHCLCKNGRTTVVYVVPCDGCNNNVLESHNLDRLSHPLWLSPIKFIWSPCFHGTETTATCACITQYHESCCLPLTPALV